MELLKSLKDVLNLSKDKVYIDNAVFRLHYRLTTIILLICSVLVTSHQYFGDPIDCISHNIVKAEVLDRYCWIQKTFSLPSSWSQHVGSRVAYPGVGHQSKDSTNRVYHAYYQWVCFVLFFQACLFYLPHYLWKAVEGGRLKKLTKKIPDAFASEKKYAEAIHSVLSYMQLCQKTNLRYGLSYVSFEILNLVNVVGQAYLMDCFLGGEFFTYGLQVIAFTEWSQELRYDPMIKRFPRVTKCTFRNFGPSGDVQKTDHMCLLSVNIINEKIYLFLWFWFVVLTVVTIAALFYRVGVLLNVQHFRYRSLTYQGFAPGKTLWNFCHRVQIGDFLFITLLSQNIDKLSYDRFLGSLLESYDSDYPDSATEKERNLWKGNECRIDLRSRSPHRYRGRSPDLRTYSTTDM